MSKGAYDDAYNHRGRFQNQPCAGFDHGVAMPTGKLWSAMTVIRARDRLAA